MAFSNTNDYVKGKRPVPTPAEPGLVSVRFAQTFVAGDLDSISDANSIGAVAILPAGYVPSGGIVIDSDDMDLGTSLAFSLGLGNLALQDATGAVSSDAANTLISTHARDGGAAWITGITTGQAGGAAVFYSKVLSRIPPANYDRYIVLKVTGTGVGSGEFGITLSYRAAQSQAPY